MYKKVLEKYETMEKSSLESQSNPSTEKTYSKEEAIEMIKKSISKSLEGHVGIENEGAEEILEKGIKDAFGKGLTVLAMLHGAHYMGDSPGKPSERMKSPAYERVQSKMDSKMDSKQKGRNPSAVADVDGQVKQAYNDARAEGQAIIDKYQSGDQNIDNFLKTISMNESSGGKNTNHRQMKDGLHAGDSAVGQYGLMPNTIKEMAGRMGKDHPMSKYAKMDNNAVAQSLKSNPNDEGEVAKFMANHLNDKFKGDQNKMAYSWFQGHNLTDDHFNTSHKDYQNHDYVKKFNKHKEQFNQPAPSETTPPIK